MFYLLHGDDEFTSREQLKKLRQQGNFDYNQDSYSGGEVTLATITATCDTLPFLTDSRLVVVEGLPKKRRNETAPSTSEANPVNADETTTSVTAGKGSKAKKSKKSSIERLRIEMTTLLIQTFLESNLSEMFCARDSTSALSSFLS